MWPLRYAPGPIGAVLALPVLISEEIGLNATRLLATTGRHGIAFSADGEPSTSFRAVPNRGQGLE